MNPVNAAIIILILFVPILFVAVAIVDVLLEASHRSVAQFAAWWSSRHLWFAIGLIGFYGILLAHLFSQR
ncbi:MAG: hypothetical protein QOH92_562 [Chloroflexota bacterium]|jgi:hypothetical protein|nr:hypothetical protein [Chloroflexota bacterium]